MNKVTELSEYLEEREEDITIKITHDLDDNIPYHINLPTGWYTEKEIRDVITTLQHARRVRKYGG